MPCCPSVESLTQHLPGASLHHTAAGIFDLPYMTIEEAVQVAFPPSQPYVTPLALPPAMDPLYARPVCNYDPPEQKHELAKSVAQCRQALYKMKAESHATPGAVNFLKDWLEGIERSDGTEMKAAQTAAPQARPLPTLPKRPMVQSTSSAGVTRS